MTSEVPIVLVVDDEPSVRVATKRVLRAGGYEAKTFQDTQQLLSHGRPTGPCCVILDLRMPGEDGLQFQQRLLARGIRVPIIFVSGHGDISTTVKAMRSGAIDFLTKPYGADELLAAVAAALEKDSRLLSADQHRVELRNRYQILTTREREVFPAVAAGLLNKQIAAELGISEKTVKVHRAQVMNKMGAVAVADLVRMADRLELRWSSPDNTDAYADLVDYAALH